MGPVVWILQSYPEPKPAPPRGGAADIVSKIRVVAEPPDPPGESGVVRNHCQQGLLVSAHGYRAEQDLQ